MYTYKQTPEQKRHDTQLNKLIDAIELSLTTCKTPTEVLAVFQSQPNKTARQRYMLSDAFMRLDNDHRSTNHGLLRTVRNSPDLGRALFALWA